MGWLILLLVILFFVYLFSRFIRIHLVINDDVTVKIRYLFVSFQLIPEKEKKPKKQRKVKKKKEKPLPKSRHKVETEQNITTSEDSDDFNVNNSFDNVETDEIDGVDDIDDIDDTNEPIPEKKPSFDQKMRKLESTFNKIKEYIDSAKAPLLKFIKKIFIDIRLLNIIIGGSDPAKIALTFGAYNMIIGNILGWVSATMNLSLEPQNIDIRADFDNTQTIYNVDLTVRVRVFTVIVLVVSFALNYIKNTSNKTPTKARKDVKNG